MPWRMIIDQANAVAESNGRFFNKTNRFAQNGSANRFESQCSSLYAISKQHEAKDIYHGTHSITNHFIGCIVLLM